MKKIIFAAPLLAMLFIACDPSVDEQGPGANVTAEELTNEIQITAQSDGNNNLTISTSPSRYIKIYYSDGSYAGSGTSVAVQTIPPAGEKSFYVTTINPDGSLVTSTSKSINVTTFTDLPEIFDKIFDGGGKNDFKTTTWTWDTTDNGGIVWGNGKYGSNTAPDWWKVKSTEIDEQAAGKGLTDDGLNGWFSLSLTSGVKTSRGETGTVKVTTDVFKAGWDIGTMTFSNTIPLLGIQPNSNNARQYVYQILKADGTHLYLCAPEPGASDGGSAWFWCFKKK